MAVYMSALAPKLLYLAGLLHHYCVGLKEKVLIFQRRPVPLKSSRWLIALNETS